MSCYFVYRYTQSKIRNSHRQQIASSRIPHTFPKKKKKTTSCHIYSWYTRKTLKHFANILTTYVYVINLKFPIVPQTMSFVARFISGGVPLYLYMLYVVARGRGCVSNFRRTSNRQSNTGIQLTTI